MGQSSRNRESVTPAPSPASHAPHPRPQPAAMPAQARTAPAGTQAAPPMMTAFRWKVMLTTGSLVRDPAPGAGIPARRGGPPWRELRLAEVHLGRVPAAVAADSRRRDRAGLDLRQARLELAEAFYGVCFPVRYLSGQGRVAGRLVDRETLDLPHGFEPGSPHSRES